MDSQIKISFILPCYNTGLFLRQCVQSLLKQGFKDNEYEIICVDNAATDNTAEILSELSEQFSQIKVVTLHVNQCSGGAYNAGLSVAKGKYILFVDSDDYLKENSVPELLDMMDAEQLEMLLFNLIPFSNEDKEIVLPSDQIYCNSNFVRIIEKCSGEEYLSQALKQMEFCYLPVPAYRKFFLREFLINNEILFTPTTLGTDFLHMMESLIVVERIKCITESIYYYRFNPSGVSKVRVSEAKVEYAMNNYSKAYDVIKDSSFALDIKQTVFDYIVGTLRGYIGEIVELTENDRKLLLARINNKQFFAKISRSFIQRSCFTDYKLFSILTKVLPRKLLKRL